MGIILRRGSCIGESRLVWNPAQAPLDTLGFYIPVFTRSGLDAMARSPFFLSPKGDFLESDI